MSDVLWGSGFTPGVETVDSSALTLATVLTVGGSDVLLSSVAIYVPLSLGNPGGSVQARVWNSTGSSVLATSAPVSIPGGSTDQWLTIPLASSIRLGAGQTYVVGVFKPAGYFYALQTSYFGTHASTPAGLVTANDGRFDGSGSLAFPGTLISSSYFIDGLFDLAPAAVFSNYQYVGDDGTTYQLSWVTAYETITPVNLPAAGGGEPLLPALWRPRYGVGFDLFSRAEVKVVCNPTTPLYTSPLGTTFTIGSTTYTLVQLVGEVRAD